MFFRRFLLPATLIAAIGVPYFLNDGHFDWAKRSVNSFWKSGKSPPQKSPQPAPNRSAVSNAPPLPQSVIPVTVQPQPPIISDPVELSQFLRFDITPQWIVARWPRVSTDLANLDFEGLRVPLVSGTRIDDLAGSLTYYFDKYQRVQRITFRGSTGDERKLVNHMAQKFGLRPEPTLGRGLYLVKWNGEPKSAMRVQHASVARGNAPHNQLEIELELNRPGPHYALSDEFAATLGKDRKLGRWGES